MKKETKQYLEVMILEAAMSVSLICFGICVVQKTMIGLIGFLLLAFYFNNEYIYYMQKYNIKIIPLWHKQCEN